MKKNVLLVLLAFVLSVLFVACGEGSNTNEVVDNTTVEEPEFEDVEPEFEDVEPEFEDVEPEFEEAVVEDGKVVMPMSGLSFTPPKGYEVFVDDTIGLVEMTKEGDEAGTLDMFVYRLVGEMTSSDVYEMVVSEYTSDENASIGDRRETSLDSGLQGFYADLDIEEDGVLQKGILAFVDNRVQGVLVVAGANTANWEGVREDATDLLSSIYLFYPEVSVELPIETVNSVEKDVAPPVAESADEIETVFPVMLGATGFIGAGGEGQLVYQVNADMDAVAEFYRGEFEEMDMVERTLITTEGDGFSSIVWDGHKNGVAISLMIVDLGEDVVNVTIGFQDI